jgi:hypothetical protein
MDHSKLRITHNLWNILAFESSQRYLNKAKYTQVKKELFAKIMECMPKFSGNIQHDYYVNYLLELDILNRVIDED